MLLDGIFEYGFLLAVPVSVDPTCLVLLPLERVVNRRQSLIKDTDLLLTI